MNNDLISRDALKTAIEDLYDNTLDGIIKLGITKSLKVIDNAPTVNPYYPISEEVLSKITDAEFEHHDSFWIETPSGKKLEFEKKRPQGEWIKEGYNNFHYICSNCCEHAFYDENIAWVKSNFCPHCGADMRKENK